MLDLSYALEVRRSYSSNTRTQEINTVAEVTHVTGVHVYFLGVLRRLKGFLE